MSDRKFVVTIRTYSQVNGNKFKRQDISRVFSESRTVREILDWAEIEGVKCPELSDLHFSRYTGFLTGA